MGNDDLFRKRKAANLSRKPRAQRNKGYKRILIVTEDEKSSKDYLQAFWCHLHQNKNKLLADSVKIIASEGSSPDMVWRTAKKEVRAASKDGDYFDVVYCVMDVDQHEHLNDALQAIRDQTSPKNTEYFAIVSNPCFEYWVLLHYKDTDKPFNTKGKGKSPCDCVCDELKKIPAHKNYQKGNLAFSQMLARNTTGLQDAIQRAKRILGVDNPENKTPSTNFHVLIEFLRNHSDRSGS